MEVEEGGGVNEVAWQVGKEKLAYNSSMLGAWVIANMFYALILILIPVYSGVFELDSSLFVSQKLSH